MTMQSGQGNTWREKGNRQTQQRFARTARRSAIFLVLILLTGFLVSSLFPPFFAPATHVLLIGSGIHESFDVPTIPFVAEDQKGMEAIESTVVHKPGDIWRAARNAKRLADEIASYGLTRSDTLLVHLTAHGISQDGQAYLLCDNFDLRRPDTGRVSAAALLEQVSQSTAGVKVIFINSGTLDYDPRLGVLVNDFPRLLEEAVQKTNDASLWVYCSHASLQQSHPSRAAERSVFGLFVSEGLRGAADLDSDRTIDLRELASFASANVARWVQHVSDGNAEQTPKLMWGGQGELPSKSPTLLTMRSDSQPHALNMAESTQSTGDSRTAARRVRAKAQSTSSLLTRRPVAPNVRPPAVAAAATKGVRTLTVASGTSPVGPSPSSPEGTVPEDKTEESKQEVAKLQPETAPPTAVADSKAGVAANAEASAKAGGKPSATSSDSLAAATRLLSEAWQLRDRSAVASSSANPSRNPLQNRPHLWREYELELLGLEQRLAAGASVDHAVIASLLKAKVSNKSPATPSGETAVAAIFGMAAGGLDAAAIFPPHQVHSLALAQTLAERLQTPLGIDVAGLHDAVAQEDRNGFDDWFAKNWRDDLAVYYELRFLKRLAEAKEPGAELDWELLQIAAQTCLLGEQVAALDWQSPGWARQESDRADRLRCFAEQAIFDRIGPDWQQRVRNAFQEAAALYHASVAIHDEIRHAERLRDSVFNDSPYYMRFVRRSPDAVTGDGLQPADLDDLLSQLTSLTDLLDRPGAARIDEVVHARSALAKLQQRVQWAVGDAAAEGLLARTPIAGDCWRAELLLKTPLLAAATRPELQAAVANLERESVEGYQPANVTHVASDTKLLATASSTLSAQRWDWLLQRARLEAKFAGLCQLYEVDRSGARRPLSRYEDFAAIWQALESLEVKHQEFIDALDNSQNSPPSTATVVEPLWNAHARLGASIASFYGNIKVAPTISNACNEAAWRSSSRLLRMVDGRDAGRFRAVDIESLSATALLHSTMEWQASRLESASAYQSGGNSALLLDVADYYRRQIAEICQPPSELLSPSTLVVVARSQLDLQYASKTEFGVDFLNQGVQDVCAGVCLDYDRDQLLVIPLVDSPHDEATRETAAAHGGAADECPAFPRFAARPSVIKAGQSVRMRFHVVRRGTASQTSKLVIDAYETSMPSPAMDQATAPATGGNSRLLARHKLAVLLPVAELVVQHASGADVSEHGAVTLAPFPNRLSAFKFGVINQSTTAKRVNLSLYSLSQAFKDVQPDDFNALVAGQKPLAEFQLTAAGNAIPTFPAQEKAAEPAAEPSPAAADGGQQPPDEKAESPPAVPLKHGLLAVLEDPSSGQQTFREIKFAVQRPRRFVRPRVAYNSLSNRIEIEVTAHPRSLIPPGAPVRIGCRLASPLPGGLQGKLQDAITAPDFKGKLFIAMPSTPPQNVLLYIDIDDFPRAFIFDVPCGKHAANIPEATALMDVRLVSSLPEGWSAARASIPVALEVDAPVGSFEDAEDFIELGVDVDGTGETEPASTVRLTADRSVSVGFLKALPDGTIQLQADVTDFNIALPSNRLENVNVQVGTRIAVQGEVHQGPKIPFLIDTAPPIVGSVSPINYAGFVPVLGALELSVWVWDAGTGVQKVEAVFDTANSGEFPAEGEFIQATQQSGRQWRLRMDAGEVSGSRILLVRGVDQVGNQGPAVKVPVEIVALDGVAARGKQQTVELTGTVSFRDASVPDVEMKLIAVPADPKVPASGEEPLIVRTKPDGTYSIAGVRPGSYLLNAKGVLNNRVRRIAKEVTVAVGPQRSIQVDVALP